MKRIVKYLIVVIIALAVFFTVSFVAATYSYFANRIPKVYTSDDDTGQVARIGMRINLLFDRLDHNTFTPGTSIHYPDGTEEGIDVEYDPEAQWGTAANPYIISKPRHMMNLYALQRSGYFHERYINNNYNNGTYIEGSSIMPYFRVCDTDGTPITIDGTNVEIKPIGTEEYPFIGCVAGAIITSDGSNLLTTSVNGKNSSQSTIANFTVLAKDEIDVGLFGKISYLGVESDEIDENGEHTFVGKVSSISDLLLYDIKVQSKQTTAIERLVEHLFADKDNKYNDDHHVGILAGHIEYSDITNISVYYSSDDIKAIDVEHTGANYLCDSGIIGFVYNLNPVVTGNRIGSNTGKTIAGMAEGAGDEWGGSIDMMTMLSKLQSILTSVKSQTPQYITSQTVIVDEYLDTTTVRGTPTTANMPNFANGSVPEYYYNIDSGSYMFSDYTSSSTQYALFHSTNTRYTPQTLTTITYKKNADGSDYLYEAGYKIHNDNNYLNATYNNGTATLANLSSNNGDNAMIWVLDEDNHLSATSESFEGNNSMLTYYLNASNTGALSLSLTANTTWTIDTTNNLVYCNIQNHNWYLRFSNNTWTLYPFIEFFSISNGNNYLGQNTSTNLLGTNNNYAYWSNENGHLEMYYNGSIYGLWIDNNNSLQISNLNSTSCTVLEDGSIRFNHNGENWYLCFVNGNWSVLPFNNPQKIYKDNKYLGRNNSNTDLVVDSSNDALWGLEDGKLKLYTNNELYYLDVINGHLVLSSSSPSINWIKDNNHIYYHDNNTNMDWYIRCDDYGFDVYPYLDANIITDGSGFLGSRTNVDLEGDYPNAGLWHYENNQLMSFINGTKYYLNASDMNVSLSLSPSTSWTIDNENGYIYYLNNNQKMYLIYSYGWACFPLEEAILIGDGDNYITIDPNSLYAHTTDNEEEALPFLIDDNNKIYTVFNGEIYYLNGPIDGSTGLFFDNNSSNATSWIFSTENNQINDSLMSYRSGNTTWYLYNVDYAWAAYPDETISLISYAGTYLSVSGTNLIGANASNATAWYINSGVISTKINGTKYNLYANGNNVSLSSSSYTTWVIDYIDEAIYCNVNDQNNYLIYDTTWHLSTDSQNSAYLDGGITFINQDGIYLSVEGTSLIGTDASNASAWNNNAGVLSININGTMYYLYANNNQVSLSTTNRTIWVIDDINNKIYYDNNGINYYLIYDNGWFANPTFDYIYIKDENDNCLSFDGSSITNELLNSNPTKWFVNNNKYFTLYNENIYYLKANTTTLSIDTNINNASTFTYDSSNEQLTFVSGSTYYVVFNEEEWVVSNSKLHYKLINIQYTSGTRTYYLNLSNNQLITEQTRSSNWILETVSGNTYKIYTLVDDTKYYLSGSLSGVFTRSSSNLVIGTDKNNATTWTYNNNNLYCTLRENNTNQTYYISFDNNMIKLVRTGVTYYTIKDRSANANFLSTTTSHTLSTGEETLWHFGSDTAGNPNNSFDSTLYSIIDGSYWYLNLVRSGTLFNRTYTVSLVNSSTEIEYYRQSNGNYYIRNTGSNFYLRYNNGWTYSTGQNDNYRVTRTAYTFSAITLTTTDINYCILKEESSFDIETYVSSKTPDKVVSSNLSNYPELTIYLDNTVYDLSFANTNYVLTFTITNNSSYTYNLAIDNANRQVITKTVETAPGGHVTYFPLNFSATAPYEVNQDNTGYVTGGSHSTYQPESGDTRFARYNMNTIAYSLNGTARAGTNTYTYNATYGVNKLEILTQTYLSNGLKRIRDNYNKSNNSVASQISGYARTDFATLGLEKYEAAREQLSNGTTGVFDKASSYIYGVHFMNADISTENVFTADRVVINGITYENYELPESCIDFRLKSKGYVNFFSATNYANVGNECNCFFSLNEIFRDSNNKITDIKHIKKIYGDPTNDKKLYIYEYEDEPAPIIPTGYVEMFDTDWIESPNNFVLHALYYFEIPINAGEYALGSVKGEDKRGAYLCYLDIGASAAANNSVLGSIDFVYDNTSTKIVTVKDTSESDTSLNYYIPSLVTFYTRNRFEVNNQFVKFDNFTVNIRRYINSTSDARASTKATFAGEDGANIQLITQSASSGDTLEQTGGYGSE